MAPVDELAISLEGGGAVTALVYPASEPRIGATLILAHGAGAGQRSPFMTAFAGALAALGVDTVTFNFLYMEQGRRVPDRPAALEACYRSVIDRVHAECPSAHERLLIGGKSMGGRIATQVAAADRSFPLSGLVLLGYPLHPPGRPEQRRDAHLPDVLAPMLIIQGSRDTFGTPAEFAPILEALAPRATLHVVAGGDHSLKVAKSGKTGQVGVYADVQRTMVEWIRNAKPAR
jgi:uncharacterized protein